MSIATELQRIQTAITSAFTAVSSKGGTVPTSKTVDNLKTAIDSIPSGLDTSDATATASDILSGKTAYSKGSKITGSMSSVTAATPSISVSSSGLITASTSQSAGYVSAANKSATKQLTTQAAQTITPGTSNKTIASGRYLTGTQTIRGDSNLVAGNIKKSVSIFGVSGELVSGVTPIPFRVMFRRTDMAGTGYDNAGTMYYWSGDTISNSQFTFAAGGVSDSSVSNSTLMNVLGGILVICITTGEKIKTLVPKVINGDSSGVKYGLAIPGGRQVIFLKVDESCLNKSIIVDVTLQ